MVTTTLINIATMMNVTMGMISSAAKGSNGGENLSGTRLPVATAPGAQIAAAIRDQHLHSGQASDTVPSQLHHVAVAVPIALDRVAPHH